MSSSSSSFSCVARVVMSSTRECLTKCVPTSAHFVGAAGSTESLEQSKSDKVPVDGVDRGASKSYSGITTIRE